MTPHAAAATDAGADLMAVSNAGTNTDEPHALPEHTLQAFPTRCTKTVYFVRHAQGFHNVAGAIDYSLYKSDLYKDAHLTELGFQQARALAEHIKAQNIKVDLVVCSLMSRAIETAAVAFGTHDPPSNGKTPPLMVQTSAEEGISAAHPPISSESAPPFIAHELCREHLGVHPCDARRPTSYFRSQFPAVDYSLITEEEDVMWEAERRELDEEVSVRGIKFLQWLMTRPEQTVAVVSHSGFLQHSLSVFGRSAGPSARGELLRPFENAEMRKIILSDPVNPPGGEDPVHFPGGTAALQ